jgi:hypothetical protein
VIIKNPERLRSKRTEIFIQENRDVKSLICPDNKKRSDFFFCCFKYRMQKTALRNITTNVSESRRKSSMICIAHYFFLPYEADLKHKNREAEVNRR